MSTRSAHAVTVLRAVIAAIVVAATVLAGCGSDEAKEPTAAATIQSLSLLGGNTPLPIIPAETLPDGAVVPGPVELAWNGTYAELLAMDAWAVCSVTQMVGTEANPLDSTEARDMFLLLLSAWRLEVDSSNGYCPSPTGNSTPSNASAWEAYQWTWLRKRQDPDCNVNATTLQPEALELDLEIVGPSASPYWVPDAAELDLEGDHAEEAIAKTQARVSEAFVNLCMAQRLRAQLETLEVALATRPDLLELHSLVQERAQAAVFTFSLLAKAFAFPDELDNEIDHPDKIIPVLVAWRDWLAAGEEDRLEEFGRDFALAISTLVEASENQTEFLLRTSAAQRSLGQYAVAPDGEGVDRRRLDGARPDIAVRAYGAFAEESLRAANADMTAPEIRTILGMARAADAFELTASEATFDISANARALLVAIEEHVREGDCLAEQSMDPECAEVDESENVDDYRVAQRFGIRERHARAVVQGLVEHLFGQPPQDPEDAPAEAAFTATGDLWVYPADDEAFNRLTIPEDLTRRASGDHSYLGDFRSGEGGVLHLDRDFSLLVGADTVESQSWTYVTPRRMYQEIHPLEQGFGFRGVWVVQTPFNETTGAIDPTRLGLPYFRRPTGTIPILAAAREALLELPEAVVEVSDTTASALDLLDQAVGDRTTLIRRAVVVEEGTSSAECPANWLSTSLDPDSCHFLAPTFDGSSQPQYTIDVSTTPSDGATTLRRSQLPDADAGCMTECNLNDAVPLGMDQTLSSVSLGEHKMLKGTFSVPADSGVRLELIEGANKTLLHQGVLDSGVYTNRMTGAPLTNDYDYPMSQPNPSFGRSVTGGGQLNEQVRRALLGLSEDWSKPRYDAFGLQLDFAPMGDASLYGGPQGEEAYTYFLRIAGEAAGEATAAYQTAIDLLVEEAQDQVAFNTSRERAEGLREIEMTALCGKQVSCDPTFVATGFLIPLCPFPPPLVDIPACETVTTPPTVTDFCPIVQSTIRGMMGSGLVLATEVASQATVATPDFSAYQGGELERLLLEQWSALKALREGVDTAIRGAAAATDQDAAAEAERLVGCNELDLVLREFDVAFQEAEAADLELEAQRVLFVAQSNAYAAEFAAAVAEQDDACHPATIERGRNDGYSVDPSTLEFDVPIVAPAPEILPCESLGSDVVSAGICSTMDPPGVIVGYDEWQGDLIAWSPGPWHAAMDRCDQARFALQAALTTSEGIPANPGDPTTPADDIPAVPGLRQANLDLAASIQADLEAVDAQFIALDQRLDTGFARNEAGEIRRRAATSEGNWQAMTQVILVQDAYHRLLASTAAIHEAVARTKLRVAANDLERDLAEHNIESRFAIRKRFRSFDLWRARALSENARRLAVTARRAIEARFVVDLSEMQASEVFVEAPGLWSDDIYDSDLSPPTSVARTAAPSDSSDDAVYTNKLVDYVNNLELFVNGYALQRPRAAVRSDVEVLHLPAPAAQVNHLTVDGNVQSFINPDSVGWSFYCEESGAWIRHPSATDFGSVSGLSTACAGRPPVLARLGFSLDPWGRVNRHTEEEAYSERHNARWSALAVNLVGSGVRDCAAAPDSSACYAEPFVRYHLRHVGPASVTNYERQWRDLAVPTAVIEDGKALATEEWLDPVANGFNVPQVANVARREYVGRPLGGAYELTLELPPDVRVERIQRIQLLAESEYWVRQQASDEPEVDEPGSACGNGVIEGSENCEFGGGDGGLDGTICPQTCDDSDPCTVDTMLGSPLTCFVECQHSEITSCANSDQCCPIGCNFDSDLDCDMDLCGDGTLECDGDQSNACESLSSAVHCAACDTPCNDSFSQVAMASCASGSCEIDCEVGFEDCDDAYTSGCEVNVFDVNNCGGCASLGDNEICSGFPQATTTCPMGVCEIAMCSSGYSNCNSVVTDGCEFHGSSCWTPSNFAWSTYDFSSAPTSVLNCGTTTVDTTDPDGGGSQLPVTFTNWCGGATPPAQVVTPMGGTPTVVLLMNSLTVASASTLRLIGSRPIILAVNGDTSISGTVDANSTSTNAGAGSNLSCTPATASGAGSNGTGSSSTGGGGGGGGGFGTAGGHGGDGSGNNNGSGGATRGSSTLTPLLGGCLGGNGGGSGGTSGIGGDGGGAVQISSAGTLTVASGGIVRANGEPGTNGNGSEGGGGGGGAGGALLLEALTLAVTGTVQANGGNGGNGQGGTSGAAGSTNSGSGGATAADHALNGGGGGGGGYGRVVQRDL